MNAFGPAFSAHAVESIYSSSVNAGSEKNLALSI